MKHKRLYWLPNAITAVRAGLALVVFVVAMQQHWVLALWLFLVALGSDFLDGLAARKLHVASAFGEEFDASTDFLLGSAGIASLTLTGHIPLYIAGMLLLAGLTVGSDRFFKQPHIRGRTIVAVMGLFAVWITSALLFAKLAYGWQQWYPILTVCILIVCAVLKRNRIRVWLND